MQPGTSQPAPQQPLSSRSEHAITHPKYRLSLITDCIQLIRSSPLLFWSALTLGFGIPSFLLMLLHPHSPFQRTLAVKTGGADIAEIAPTLPQNLPPTEIKPTVNPQLLTLALNEQPTIDKPLQGFCHPLWGQGWLSQGIRSVTHNGRMEYAYDYAAAIGTPIYAMRAGRVISVQDKYPDWGGDKEQIHRFNHVWLEHDGGYRSAYVHLQQGFRQRVNLKVGDQVNAGQIIGYSGNSGWSSGPHLHVEVHRAEERFRFTQTVPFAISPSCSLGRQATDLTAQSTPKSPTVEDSTSQ